MWVISVVISVIPQHKWTFLDCKSLIVLNKERQPIPKCLFSMGFWIHHLSNITLKYTLFLKVAPRLLVGFCQNLCLTEGTLWLSCLIMPWESCTQQPIRWKESRSLFAHWKWYIKKIPPASPQMASWKSGSDPLLCYLEQSCRHWDCQLTEAPLNARARFSDVSAQLKFTFVSGPMRLLSLRISYV